MKIFAIGDLHLSTAVNKPMDVFGMNWENHEEKIFSDWKDKVDENDIVFVVGDISWASKVKEAKADLDILASMPGTKYMIRGNHDYWWSTASALKKLFKEEDKMNFMNVDFEEVGEYAVCGTRGWICPNDMRFEEKDESIYKREANRLKLSLEAAKKAGFEKYIVLLHYPPTNDENEESLFTEVIKEYRPEHVIYGHLHGEESFPLGVKGEIDGINYHLVSCDYLDFSLKEIMEI
ncbi:metallophosphoesterase [Peptostreptococcus russellii]|uniref:metallophosphoesterase n=1 Tax=Peptostreptococcus russellii TaxID=215200 RepID=UPI002943AF43|nr:metallophosphoesterase [Peptostreptococcus russellii]